MEQVLGALDQVFATKQFGNKNVFLCQAAAQLVQQRSPVGSTLPGRGRVCPGCLR